jgi:hypothetical protein
MLNKQLVPLAFRQGLDTKRDKKQQLYGTLRKAENVVFETLESARKRNGYDSLELLSVDGSSIGTPESLAAFKNELLTFTASTLWGYSSALARLENRGSVYSVFPTSFPVVNNSFDNIQPDLLQISGLKMFVYRNDSTGAIHYAVQDVDTETMLVSDQIVAVAGDRPRIQAIGNKVYLLYVVGNAIRFRTFNRLQPAILDVEKTLVSNISSTNPNFDCVQFADRIVVAYNSTNVLARLHIVVLRTSDIASAPITFAGQDPTTALDLYLDKSGNIVITWADAAAAKYLVYTGNLNTVKVAPQTLELHANIVNITTCETSSLGSYEIYYAISAANSYDYHVRVTTATDTGSMGTPEVFMRSVGLASKSFEINDICHLMVSYDSVGQATNFVVDDDAVIVAKISAGVAGGHVQSNVLPKLYYDDSTATIVSTYRTKLVAENGEFYSLNGVTNTLVDFAVEERFQNATLGNNMLVAGGILQAYDGQRIVEQGFNVYPETPTLTALAAGTATNWPSLAMDNSGSLLDTYGYCIVYRWTDHQGQEHRSAPSESVDIHLASPAEVGVQVDIPTLRLSQKQDVVVEVYRTEENGTLFYLANEIEVPFLNDPAVDSVQFIDGRPDSALISGRLLYTTGGVLENISAPSASIVATHTASKRIFLAGLENANEVMYSKIANPGQPVEFNDLLRLPIDPIGGKITALASMDEKLVIFESDALFFMSGSGPNNAGQQDSFTTPERISTDIGCIAPKSVVLTPDGLMFKSRKGIYILTRALGLEYIGAPVEEFNGLTITGSDVVGELNQVRFTTSDGDCLVYNYVFKFWATFTNHMALSAVVIGNDYYYLRRNGALYKENRLSYSDAGTPIKMRLEIGWISFAVLQGFSRVYKMLVLGDWYSAHNLLVQVAYDFTDIYLQSATISPASGQFEATPYGEDSPYGEPAPKPYGGTGSPYQARVNFKQQKCQSIKLLIEDVQENAGQGLSLSQITFQVGGKTGMFKMAKGKSFATS